MRAPQEHANHHRRRSSGAPAKKSTVTWTTEGVMEPILVQIIGVGVNAFMTVKANVPANATLRTPKKEYNQKAVWTNEQDTSRTASSLCSSGTRPR